MTELMTDEQLAELTHYAATTALVDASRAMFDLLAEVDLRGKEIGRLNALDEQWRSDLREWEAEVERLREALKTSRELCDLLRADNASATQRPGGSGDG